MKNKEIEKRKSEKDGGERGETQEGGLIGKKVENEKMTIPNASDGRIWT